MGFFARTQKRAADLFDQLKQSVQSFATETGRDASESARQVKDDLGNKINDAGQKVHDTATRMTDAVNDAILATKNGGQRVLDDTADAVNNAMATVRDRAIRARQGVAAGIETMMNGARDLHRGAMEARERIAAQSSIFAKTSVDTVRQSTHQAHQSVLGHMTSFAKKLAEKKEDLFRALATDALNFADSVNNKVENLKDKVSERIMESSEDHLKPSANRKVFAGIGVTATALAGAVGSPVAAGVVAGSFALGAGAMVAAEKTQSMMLDMALKRRITKDLLDLGVEDVDAKAMAKELLPFVKIEMWQDASEQNQALQDAFKMANATHSPEGAISRDMRAGKEPVSSSVQKLLGLANSAQDAVKNIVQILDKEMPENNHHQMKVKADVADYLRYSVSYMIDRLNGIPVKIPEKLLESLNDLEQKTEAFSLAGDMMKQSTQERLREARNAKAENTTANDNSNANVFGAKMAM